MSDCVARYLIELNGGICLAESGWDGNYYSVWSGELWCCRALNGYYLSPYWFTSWNVWYTGVKPCTNAPENTVYTGPGTPDSTDGTIIDANDCPGKCADSFGRTAADMCAPLCKAGVTKLKTSSGVSVPLFASKNTKPAIYIGYNNMVCYADLKPGGSSGAIHTIYNGTECHTTNDKE